MKIKYPRTLHLPWSETITSDDRKLLNCSVFEGKKILVTEKMDGENTSMYNNCIHARSLDSRDHESRSFVKRIHSRISHEIPNGWRICGENLFAKHSISYDNLSDYFLVFSIWDENNICLPWCQTKEYCKILDLKMVPTILTLESFDENTIRNISIDCKKTEGYVVRNYNEFHYSQFSSNVAKYVRKNHVQTDSHWMNSIIEKNKLVNE